MIVLFYGVLVIELPMYDYVLRSYQDRTIQGLAHVFHHQLFSAWCAEVGF